MTQFKDTENLTASPLVYLNYQIIIESTIIVIFISNTGPCMDDSITNVWPTLKASPGVNFLEELDYRLIQVTLFAKRNTILVI